MLTDIEIVQLEITILFQNYTKEVTARIKAHHEMVFAFVGTFIKAEHYLAMEAVASLSKR